MAHLRQKKKDAAREEKEQAKRDVVHPWMDRMASGSKHHTPPRYTFGGQNHKNCFVPRRGGYIETASTTPDPNAYPDPWPASIHSPVYNT